MENLNKYLKRIENALKKLEKHKAIAKEASENSMYITSLEAELISIKKNRISAQELIDQAIEEIQRIRKNSLKKVKSDG